MKTIPTHPPIWPGPAFLSSGIAMMVYLMTWSVWATPVMLVLSFVLLMWLELISTPLRDAPPVTGRATDHEDQLPRGRGGATFPGTHNTTPLAPAPRWGSADPLG